MSSKITKYNVLTAAKCGIEFEFYTEKTIANVSKELGKVLNKKVIVTKSTSAFNKKSEIPDHHDVTPTSTVFKLMKDFSGGKNMIELITGPLTYEESRIVIIKTHEWIKSNGWTDKKCGIHLNLSFNNFLIKLKNDVSHIDVLKMVLSYDEQYIYDRFPDRKNSVYAKSILQVIPNNKFAFQNNASNIDPTNFKVPDEKYYGINFTKRSKNYLEFRYLGGKGYEYKTAKILEILDYSILKMYDALEHPTLNNQEIQKLKSISVNMEKISEIFSNPARFFIEYPELYVFVDMRGDKEIIKSYWTVLRDQLFSLIVDGGLKKGMFNLDTDISVFQLRDATLKNAHNIENIELFDCTFDGSGENISFYRCKIKNSRIKKCKLIELNEIEDSKVEHTSSFESNTFINCYIDCPSEIVDGKIIGGVIRNAIVGKNAEVSQRTLIVDQSSTDKGGSFDNKKSYFSDDDKK